mmetsp:Transcript_13035/g.30980  ORF Transcript_13035/g.30980 Transcript_13035/m.30980 type:complete len:89 (-) Transcript_13035:1471-1737(-)
MKKLRPTTQRFPPGGAVALDVFNRQVRRRRQAQDLRRGRMARVEDFSPPRTASAVHPRLPLLVAGTICYLSHNLIQKNFFDMNVNQIW